MLKNTIDKSSKSSQFDQEICKKEQRNNWGITEKKKMACIGSKISISIIKFLDSQKKREISKVELKNMTQLYSVYNELTSNITIQADWKKKVENTYNENINQKKQKCLYEYKINVI